MAKGAAIVLRPQAITVVRDAPHALAEGSSAEI